MRYTVIIPAPDKWINSNHRLHWAVKSGRIRNWREATYLHVKSQHTPRIDGPVRITALVHRSDKRSFDAHNFGPTIKAAIDGIVDAEIIPDDNNDILKGLNTERGDKVTHPGGQLTLIITQEETQ